MVPLPGGWADQTPYQYVAMALVLAFVAGGGWLLWTGGPTIKLPALFNFGFTPDVCLIAPADRDVVEPLVWQMRGALFVIWPIDEVSQPPRRFMIVWSKNMAAQQDKLTEVLQRSAPGARIAVLPLDATPMPDLLLRYAKLENTTRADIAWQWRVYAQDMPADSIERLYKKV